uniref:pre-toxin TG domain-containing protein n=1 Tax=Chitinivorax sp. B TaxID=2502235 RepID=UPI002016AFD1
SLGLDLVPVLGSAKSAAQVVTGKDLLTGEPVNRWVEAGGMVLGMVPGGKLLTKGTTLAKVARGAEKGAVKGGTGASYDKLYGQGIYVLRDEDNVVRYIGRGDAPDRLLKHEVTPGKDHLAGEIIWRNNLTKAQAKGLEQALIDHYGGNVLRNSDTPLMNIYRSYSPFNPNARKYSEAVSTELWDETLRRIGQ